jgi:hypothetical protein
MYYKDFSLQQLPWYRRMCVRQLVQFSRSKMTSTGRAETCIFCSRLSWGCMLFFLAGQNDALKFCKNLDTCFPHNFDQPPPERQQSRAACVCSGQQRRCGVAALWKSVGPRASTLKNCVARRAFWSHGHIQGHDTCHRKKPCKLQKALLVIRRHWEKQA